VRPPSRPRGPFGRRFWTLSSLYVVLAGASLPLLLGLVPPNGWYGFRLPGLRLDPAVWYEINSLGARLFIAAMVICAALNALLFWKGTDALLRIAEWINAGLIFLSFWLVSVELVQALPY
jgi:SdpI/YfhL protein family